MASVTGTKIAQYAYDGCRTKDVLMMLGGNVKKDRYYEAFLEKGIFAAAKRVPPKASVDALHVVALTLALAPFLQLQGEVTIR